jgi:cytochrome oxidase Cu insertion factor (SCO1/SenC/PrrC family)
LIQVDPARDRRQRRMLVGLALLFFAPLAVSFYLYYGPVNWRPTNHVNHGDLIDPARPLPAVALPLAKPDGADSSSAPDLLRSKWTLLYVGDGSCPDGCRRELYNTRQVRFALNRDMERVQRIFLATGHCCDWQYLHAEQPDLVTLLETRETAALIALLPRYGDVPAAAADRVYIIDPLGNLMMSYAPTAPPKGMLTDLKRLLGLSHVG